MGLTAVTLATACIIPAQRPRAFSRLTKCRPRERGVDRDLWIKLRIPRSPDRWRSLDGTIESISGLPALIHRKLDRLTSNSRHRAVADGASRPPRRRRRRVAPVRRPAHSTPRLRPARYRPKRRGADQRGILPSRHVFVHRRRFPISVRRRRRRVKRRGAARVRSHRARHHREAREAVHDPRALEPGLVLDAAARAAHVDVARLDRALRRAEARMKEVCAAHASEIKALQVRIAPV